MLLPLGIGLFIKARYEETAESLQPHMGQISSMAIVVMMVTILVLQFSTIIGTIGTGGVLAALEQGSPRQIFDDPQEERTRTFLSMVL